MSRDQRIDVYIEKAPEFARPILTRLREVIHDACPDAEETLKWGHPSFMYGGGILCGFAAFKAHCTFGFWKGSLVVTQKDGAMGQFGRLTSLKDLPPKPALRGYVRKAMELTDKGVKAPSQVKRKTPRPEASVPPDLRTALGRNRKARETFEGFSPSHRREYIEWITEAKTEATRERRLATTLEWLAEGKARNWKYM